jgi:hypothetical protein
MFRQITFGESPSIRYRLVVVWYYLYPKHTFTSRKSNWRTPGEFRIFRLQQSSTMAASGRRQWIFCHLVLYRLGPIITRLLHVTHTHLEVTNNTSCTCLKATKNLSRTDLKKQKLPLVHHRPILLYTFATRKHPTVSGLKLATVDVPAHASGNTLAVYGYTTGTPGLIHRHYHFLQTKKSWDQRPAVHVIL